MCIRDRGLHNPLDRPVASAWEEALIKTNDLKLECSNKQCCLLYTSDAADERSSVDLGGRRIIKKQNKNN